MPLYEYLCSKCGHSDTLLEQLNSPRRKTCPTCAKQQGFERQLSAAAFHLKGKGWYATDFRNGDKPAATENAATKKEEHKSEGSAQSDSGSTKSDKSDKSDTNAASVASKPDKTPKTAPAHSD